MGADVGLGMLVGLGVCLGALEPVPDAVSVTDGSVQFGLAINEPFHRSAIDSTTPRTA